MDIISLFILIHLTVILLSSQIFEPKFPWVLMSYLIGNQILNKSDISI